MRRQLLAPYNRPKEWLLKLGNLAKAMGANTHLILLSGLAVTKLFDASTNHYV